MYKLSSVQKLSYKNRKHLKQRTVFFKENCSIGALDLQKRAV